MTGLSNTTPTSLETRARALLEPLEDGTTHTFNPDAHRDSVKAAHMLVVAGLAIGRTKLSLTHSGSSERIEFGLEVCGFWCQRSIVLNTILDPMRQCGWTKDRRLNVPLTIQPSWYYELQISELGEMALKNDRGDRHMLRDSFVGTSLYWFRLPWTAGVDPRVKIISCDYSGFGKNATPADTGVSIDEFAKRVAERVVDLIDQPNSVDEGPGGSRHDGLMRAVHEIRATTSVPWTEIPERLLLQGFAMHGDKTLNRWYTDWKKTL